MYFVFFVFFAILSLSSCWIIIPESFNITLQCLPDHVETLSGAKQSWSFTSDETRTPQQLQEHGRFFHLQNMSSSKEGDYRCVQVGWKGESRIKLTRTFRIRMKAAPRYEKWQVVSESFGSDAMLPCQLNKLTSAQTDPPPVYWERRTEAGWVLLKPQGTPLSSGEQDKNETAVPRVFWDSRPEQHDWSIRIHQITKEDAGIYQCVINSTSEKMLVELEVSDPSASPCHGFTSPWEACVDPEDRTARFVLRESLAEFSSSVYRHLRGPKITTNLLFSPISIAAALSHMLLGARGETRKILEDALKLPNNFSCVHSEMKKQKQLMNESLDMSAAFFHQPDQKFREAFINQSLEFYDVVPRPLTNDSAANAALINNWVKEKTRGKIEELVEDVDPSTRFVLLNAVHFSGKWKFGFDSTVKQKKFKGFAGQTTAVSALHSTQYSLQYGPIHKLKANVGRFLLSGHTSLYVLLPSNHSEQAFREMEGKLNYDNIQSMVDEMSKFSGRSTEVHLPKIKLSVTTPMEALLEQLGLSDLTGTPNLCGMFPEQSDSFVSEVHHKAFLSLSEKGVEAAAATAISYSRSISSFSALRPFVLIVWSDELRVPLFMGRVVDP